MAWVRLTASVALSLVLVGCGAGEAEVVEAPRPDTSGVVIPVEGEFSTQFDGQNGKITFAANSVDNATDFNVTKLSTENLPEAGFLASGYELSPTNLILNAPATLTLTFDTSQTADLVVIARLVGTKWLPLFGSTVTENTVSAEITELGTYAVISVSYNTASKVVSSQCDGSTQSVRFIHVADLHSRFGFKNQYYSKIRQYYLDAKAQNPMTLFTNGGDDYEKGTVAELTSEGFATNEAVRAMAFDLRVVGNHDYAWGEDVLLDYAKDDNAIVLASNTYYLGDDQNGFAAVDFAKVQMGCITLGVFGMTSVPWNELDEPLETAPIPDFIQNFKMRWQWQQVANAIATRFAGEVDYMVMLSHLGEGLDEDMVNAVPEIDLALGGHTHGGDNLIETSQGQMVVQPNFYGQGLTDLTLTFDSQTKALINSDYKVVVTDTLTQADPIVKAKIDAIMAQYAPESQSEIAVSENYPSTQDVAAILAKASAFLTPHDAAILDPSQVDKRWRPGTLTQEDFHKAYLVERQPSDTPGFNSLYHVTVSGSELTQMLSKQSEWVASQPDSIDPSANYTVLLQKGPALNLALFFDITGDKNPTALYESWFALDKYARERTLNCVHLDTETRLNACQNQDPSTAWQFDDANAPLSPLRGEAELRYFDPDNNQDTAEKTRFVNTQTEGINPLPTGHADVLAFSDYGPDEGIALFHNAQANGDYQAQGLVADYTLVMDLYWPSSSDGRFRALLQTNTQNADDADIFVDRQVAGGVGIATRDSGFFGSLAADTWYRVGLVFYAAPEGGVFKVFINGELVGEKDEGLINDRWALSEFALLFTDDTFETQEGYLNALFFSPTSLTNTEMASLGGPGQSLKFSPSAKTLSNAIERHLRSAPVQSANPWLMQRKRFFHGQ